MQDTWLKSHFSSSKAAQRFQKHVAQVADEQAREATTIKASFGTRTPFESGKDFLGEFARWHMGGTALRRKKKRELKKIQREARFALPAISPM